MKKSIKCCILLFIGLGLLLAGCGSSLEKILPDENIKSENRIRTYKKEVCHLTVPENTYRYSISFDAACENVYFATREDDNTSKLYKSSITEDAESEAVLSFDGYYLCSSVGKRTDVVFEKDGNCLLEIYDDFKKTSVIELDDDFSEEGYPIKIMAISEDKHLVVSPYALLCVDDSGNQVFKGKCPGDRFNSGILLQDGSIIIAYIENGKCVLATVDKNSGALTKINETETSGMFLCEENGEILLSDGKNIYSFDRLSKETDLVYDLSVKSVKSDFFSGFNAYGDKLFVACYGMSESEREMDIVILSPGEDISAEGSVEVDEDGRQIVYLVSEVSAENLKTIYGTTVEQFNFENQDYCIRFKEKDMEISGDLFLAFRYSTLEKYANNGYLKDLWPFINGSDKITATDLCNKIVEASENEGKLYALSDIAGVETLLLRRAEVAGNDNWTTDDFISWIESGKEVLATRPLNRETVLEYCLLGNLEEYADIENIDVHFDSSEFKQLLCKIKELKFSDENDEALFLEMGVPEGIENRALLLNEKYYDMSTLGLEEALLGDDFVLMGYPNNFGKTISVFSPGKYLSVLVDGNCPEGAYAFIEYLLTKGDPNGAEVKGTLYTIDSLREKSCKEALGTHEEYVSTGTFEYEVTQNHYELLMDIFDSAKIDSDIEIEIRNIVLEEFDQFIHSDTDVDTTCNVINSRVKILLEERR